MSSPAIRRCVCVHGHFYQPPRENPWLEAVEVQDSAAPAHDWNERVTSECYAPNAAARLLDEQGRITALRNNYARISFNFGPTLLHWMAQARPQLHAQILDADRDSVRAYGRGNALAQVYGHSIMPLASRRDQQTQVRWGIADFVHRFGRRPDGMWLPETAVDRRSLQVLAEEGIRFTILAPSQAARVRYAGGEWEDAGDGGLDTTRAYRCVLAPGLAITLFLYDAGIAHAIAFGGLLNDGRELARRLTAAGSGGRRRPGADAQLVHVATDGESYGHHHRFGEMALAAAIETLERDGEVELTNYAAFLDRTAVVDDVQIRENTSWSCAHGVERWRSDCGCRAADRPGWQQAWRAPLRAALDWLQQQLDALFEREGGKLLRDPWAARDAYVEVLLQRDPGHRDAFLQQHARSVPQDRVRIRIWKLLEMQRHVLLSFTSCGWFFDEPSGIETVQNLTYAARAIQLAGELGGNLEPEFLHRLQAVRSNVDGPEGHDDGRQIYRRLVRPQVTDLSRVAAHAAMQSLFGDADPARRVYAYEVDWRARQVERSGAAAIAVGGARVSSDATEESDEYSSAALHLGGHDMHCAVAGSGGTPAYATIRAELLATFLAEPLSELVRRIDQSFGRTFYTLRHMFVEERRRILQQITAQLMSNFSADYERMVTDNRRLLDFLAQARVPLPVELSVAATFVIQRRLVGALADFRGQANVEAVRAVWADARRWSIVPAMDGVRRILEEALLRALADVASGDAEAGVRRAHAALDAAGDLELTLDLWATQNQYYILITTARQRRWSAAVLPELRRLGQRLFFQLREWDALAAHAA